MLVVALASGATVKEAAQQAGVSERTAWRRLADAGFKRCVVEAKAELVTRAVAKLSDGATKAVDTLLAVMDGEDPRARIAAARAVLEYALPARADLLAEAEALRPTEQSHDLPPLGRTRPTGPASALPGLFDADAAAGE